MPGTDELKVYCRFPHCDCRTVFKPVLLEHEIRSILPSLKRILNTMYAAQESKKT